MKTKSFIVLLGLALFFVAQCFAQTKEEEKKAIVELIKESYIGASHNNIDIEILKKGFHESFTWQNMHHDRFGTTTLRQWIILFFLLPGHITISPRFNLPSPEIAR